MACDERSFAPEDATLRIGQAIGADRSRVLGGTVRIVPGQALLLSASRPGYVCALFANGLEARAGWVPQAGVARAVLSVDPVPPLDAWGGPRFTAVAFSTTAGRVACATTAAVVAFGAADQSRNDPSQ